MKLNDVLDDFPLIGVSQKFRSKYLQLIIRAYLRGEQEESVANFLRLSFPTIRSVYSEIEKVMKGKPLPTASILERVYNRLLGENSKEYSLGEGVYSMTDSGEGGEKSSFIRYKNFNVIKVDGQTWLLAFGGRPFGYLGLLGFANPNPKYVLNLLAFQIDFKANNIVGEVSRRIEKANGLEDSLLVVKNDGTIIPGSGALGKAVGKNIDPIINKYAIEDKPGTYNSQLVSSLEDFIKRGLKALSS